MIHPLSSVHPDAQIAETAEIGPFVTIDQDVVIGDGCWVGPHATIMNGSRIGKNCKIFPGSVISAVPQDLKYRGEETTVEIGDNTVIRECVTINKGTSSFGKTVIGNNCLLMAYSHVAHDCRLGNNVILVNYVGLAGEIEIGDFAYLGGMCGVHQFVKIGSHTMIQGGSMVGKDVPPFVLAGRDPLRFEGINVVGLRRRGFTEAIIEEIHEIYRFIYQRGLNTTQALEKIENELEGNGERDMIVAFVRNSQRGIIKGPFNDPDAGPVL
ncbi:MAG: acyl-ACP--UDP-N-acetylglucosamine O-acyltransferase [Bacteroidales bacterium]|jgi:UDP-N-acetylglucosamine acyltransferase|nr:acyl-ACP--UDP-N-acetylglucosamine O-acyltransferase [Bacteroidales bacterium]